MGAVGTQLPIRRLRADADSPAALHRALWDKVDYTIGVMVSGRAGEQVLSFYLSMVAEDGFDDGSWISSETHLDFRFTDSAGLCSMSSLAALHWLDMALWTEPAVQRLIRDAGWEIVSLPRVPAIRNVLEARTPAFVELRDNLYAVSRRPRGARIDDDDFYSDDGIPKPTLAELTGEERLAVESAAYSGECSCEYCRNTLYAVLLGPWQEGEREAVPATWALLDELPREENAARAAVAAFSEEQWAQAPLGPPELKVLRDSLAARGLMPSIARLVPMLLQRQSQ